MKAEQGFSLIELLITVAILSVLAAMALPGFAANRQKALDIRAEADLKNAITAQNASFAEREAYNECSDAGCNDPALIGFRLSPGVSGECTLLEDGAEFQCGFSHPQGSKIFYYTSSSSTFWQTPQ